MIFQTEMLSVNIEVTCMALKQLYEVVNNAL